MPGVVVESFGSNRCGRGFSGVALCRRYPDEVLAHVVRPNLIAYGVATAIAIATIVFFGWAGFWLGLVVLVLTKVGTWGVPLIKLSYAQRPDDADRRS